jgi:hypothetical protein
VPSALLDDHAEALEPEQGFGRVEALAQEQLERGVGRLVVIAAMLPLLEVPQDAADALVVAFEDDAELARLAQDGGFPGELRDEDALLVADLLRIDVLERLRRLVDGGDVQPAL